MTSQWFGDYEIVKRLRVGGMATLYLARRHGAAGFSRLVALKMIHSHLVEQPTFVEMFVDEAKICSQINHPNVVHVEEFGVIDDVHYLVMEYLDGCSISELLVLHHRERRMLDPELAARVILQVAAGLHAAHETRGDDGQPLDVIHRDISPSNILVSSDGNAKLIDFGIAKARNRLAETEAGITLKGKYRYVAPEQATRTAVDRRCDIFSLGIVFWEMLVGRPLFPEDTHVALFNRLTQTEVTPPSELNPAVPVVLDAVVLAMLRHDPADRPQTAAEVQRRIASAIPAAANRDPSELGALVIEVRDKRAARHARGEPASRDSHVSFSPTPRSRRSTSGPQLIDEVAPASGAHGTGTAGTTSPPRWTGRRLQLTVAALLCVAVMVGLLVGQRGGRPEASASTTPAKRQVDDAVPVTAKVQDRPASAVIQPPAQLSPPVAPSLPPAAPATAVPPPAQTELAMPAVAAASPVVPVRGPAAAPVQPAKREPARVVVKAKPVRRAVSDAPAEPVPAGQAPGQPGGKLPFSSVPFDDPGNEHPAHVEPVPGFDN